jgi:hypothetical protein
MAVQEGFTGLQRRYDRLRSGMRGGAAAIGPEWSAPVAGQLDTSIFGVGRVRVEDAVEKTLSHMA